MTSARRTPGINLIVRSVALTDDCLLFDYEYRPELTEDEDEEIWPNICYNADGTAPGWHTWESEAEDCPWPVPQARYAWFDFYPTDYEWTGPSPYSNHLPYRVARLTFDLHTGETRIEKQPARHITGTGPLTGRAAPAHCQCPRHPAQAGGQRGVPGQAGLTAAPPSERPDRC